MINKTIKLSGPSSCTLNVNVFRLLQKYVVFCSIYNIRYEIIMIYKTIIEWSCLTYFIKNNWLPIYCLFLVIVWNHKRSQICSVFLVFYNVCKLSANISDNWKSRGRIVVHYRMKDTRDLINLIHEVWFIIY